MGKGRRYNKKNQHSAKQSNRNGQNIRDNVSILKSNNPASQQVRSEHKLCKTEGICDFTVFIIMEDASPPLDFILNKDITALELKKLISRRMELKIEEQHLKMDGKVLADSQSLFELLPKNRSWAIVEYIYDLFNLRDEIEIILHLEVKYIFSDLSKMWFLDPVFFDPHYDQDFRDHRITIWNASSGRAESAKPLGSYLKALNVRGKYEDNIWLGDEGEKGAWSVAYHGSSFENIQNIIESGRLQEKFAKRCWYGPGIYCSPVPGTALDYAKEYQYEKKLFRSLLQVRVDPRTVRVMEEGNIWVAPEKSVRITGICR